MLKVSVNLISTIFVSWVKTEHYGSNGKKMDSGFTFSKYENPKPKWEFQSFSYPAPYHVPKYRFYGII